MSRSTRTYSTKPVVVLSDGRECYLVTKGDEQSLLYVIEDGFENHYPNYLFKPKQQKIQLRLKHRRKRTPLLGGGGQ